MSLILLAGLALAYLLWRSAPFRRGGWRVGAGLLALALVVVGAVIAIKGDEWIGLPMALAGVALAMAGRFNRGGGRRASAPRPAPAEAMSAAEARSILGVGEGASTAEIKAAYVRLMKRMHPDQGGTAGLASKLNAARERLLKAR